MLNVIQRGLTAGVIERAVACLREIGRGPIRAYLGPCIHPTHYEFGEDDLAREVHRYAAPRLPQPAEPNAAAPVEPAFAMAGGPGSGIIEID
jgi:copper oxidase (laccase) domain-containing protein